MPDDPEDWAKHEQAWRDMHKKKLGELLDIKLGKNASPYVRTLCDMEMERRTFIRDKAIDRWLSVAAIVVSIASLVFVATRAIQLSPSPVSSVPPSPSPMSSPTTSR